MRKYLFFILSLVAMPLAAQLETILEPVEAPFETGKIALPLFPQRQAEVKMNKKGLSTQAIQKAIDHMSEKGGGTVIIPEGSWTTGRLELKSNVNLRIPEGAELRFSGEVKDYLPAVFTRHEGVEMMSLGACIYANGAKNIAVTGNGKLTGPRLGCELDALEKNDGFVDQNVMADTPVADRLYDGQQGRRFFRPSFMGLMHCEGVLIESLTMTNSVFWNIVTEYCDNVIIRKMIIDSNGTPRGDAVDIESSSNVLIEHCQVNTTDDAYALKAGRGWDGLRVSRPTENVIIRYCLARHSAGGVAIGSETAGGIRNVYVHDCTFENVQNGSYIKTRRIRGGGCSNIWMERIKMLRPRTAFYWDMLGNARYVGELAERLPMRELTPLTPEFRDIHFKDITIESCGTFIHANGLPERPIRNVTFEHIQATGQEFIKVADMDAKFDNVLFNGLGIDWK